jgi:hypothetical protein
LYSDNQKPAWFNQKNWISGFTKLWSINQEEIPTLITNIIQLQEFKKNFKESNALRRLAVIPIESLGNSDYLWQEVLMEEGRTFPTFRPSDSLVNISSKITTPGIGIVFDRTTGGDLIEETTLLIPHWESPGFLRMCLESISHTFSGRTMPKIIVLDDNSSQEVLLEVQDICAVNGAKVQRIYRADHRKIADVGRVLDEGIQLLETKYVCMLDADTLILKPEFITAPIKLLDTGQYSSVGLDTGLAESYHARAFRKNRAVKGGFETNPPGCTSITNNLYRVMLSADAQAISTAIGFSRNAQARKFRDQVGRLIRKLDGQLKEESNLKGFSRELIKKRVLNSQFPNMPPTSDNGVNANFWMDMNEMGWKCNIPIISFGFKTPNDGVCFQNISNLLVHIALSTRALSSERREITNAGVEFYKAVEEIVGNSYKFEDLSKKIINLSLKNLDL